jgi:hypothetical protein
MNRRFVTELVEEKNPIWLVSHRGAYQRALTQLLEAANFEVLFTDLNSGKLSFLGKAVDEERPQTLVWVYQDENLSEEITRFISQERLQVVLVSFDHPREREGKEKTLSRLQQLGISVSSLSYAQVFSLNNPALSSLDSLLRENLREGNIILGEPVIQPLWYEDVAAHAVGQVVSFKKGNETYIAERSLSISAFISQIFSRDEMPSVQIQSNEVPRVNGKSIPSRDVSAFAPLLVPFYEQLLPVVTPEVKKEEKLEKREVASTKVVTRAKKTHRLVKKRVIGLLVIASMFLGMATFLGLSSFQVHSLDKQVRSLYMQPPADPLVFKDSLLEVQGKLKVALLFEQVKGSFSHLIGQSSENTLTGTLVVLNAAIEGEADLLNARSDMEKAYSSIMGGKSGDGIALLKEADIKLDSAYQSLSVVQARLSQDPQFFSSEVGGKELQEYLVSTLPIQRKSISNGRAMLGALPSLLGGADSTATTNGKRLYAVIFQDATELRSSGGRIVAAGLLSFEKGKLLDVQVYPVSSLDSLLPGTVAAPDEVKTYLHLPSWQLKDANWEPSFKKVSAQISWFLNRQLQKDVDGVVVLNSSSIPDLLNGVGSLDLQTSKKTITKQNVEKYLADALLAQPKDPTALNSLYTDIFASYLGKLQRLSTDETTPVWNSLLSLFNTAEAYVYVSDEETQRVFAGLAWEGSSQTPSCPSLFQSGMCMVESVFESENSLGGNNVNPFIKRKHLHHVRIGESLTVHERTEEIQNTATNSTWPLGSYQALLKVTVDDHSQLQAVSLNGTALRPGQFTLTRDQGKKTVNLFVDVPIGTKATIRIVYTTPGIAPQDTALVIFEQKQPGTQSDPYTLKIEYPDSYTPKTIAPRANVDRNTLIFEGKRDQNRLYAVSF